MGAHSGADAALARALSEFTHVVWVDPALDNEKMSLDRVTPTLARLRPGGSTSLLHGLTRRRRTDRAIATAVAEVGATDLLVVLADPTGRFPVGVHGHRLYYVTDDWVIGARRLGLNRRAVRASIAHNSSKADTVAATSDLLAQRLHLYSKVVDAVRVIPSGCTVPTGCAASFTTALPTRDPIDCAVVLTGPLDDTLDYRTLTAVADAGHDISVFGATGAFDPGRTALLDAFLAHPRVHRRDAEHLASARVGIAPFVDDAFARARSPLQPLNYLAAGLAVVTTESEAVGPSSSEYVVSARSTAEFVRFVSDAVAAAPDPAARDSRRDIARANSWTARAVTMLRLASMYRETPSRGKSERTYPAQTHP